MRYKDAKHTLVLVDIPYADNSYKQKPGDINTSAIITSEKKLQNFGKR